MAAVLQADIEERLRFVAVQVEAGGDKDALMKGQSMSIVATIACMEGVTMQTATEVGQFINSGPWSAEQKQQINRALSDAMSNSDKATGGSTRSMQRCDSIHN